MKQKTKIIIFCIFVSFIFLLVCTKSSPLYAINDWYDANAFFTMGKSMMKGAVPYLDLFEQKGPLLYLIYGLGSLVSGNTHIGIFIIEIILFSIFLYYTTKTISLFIDTKFSYLILPLITAIITASRPFTHGGSCEEFCFPLIAISLYYFLKYLKTNIISKKEIFILGICIGAIFWMKFSLLGFHIGIYLAFLIECIKNKDYKLLKNLIVYTALGLIVMSIPWFIYFLIKGALKDMINTYFLFNIVSYANKISIIDKTIIFLTTIKNVLVKYYVYILFIFLPLIISIKHKVLFNEKRKSIYLLVAAFLLLALIFIGGVNFRYYSLPMYPLIVIGFIVIVKTITEVYEIDIKKAVNMLSVVGVIALSFIYVHHKSPNIQFLSKPKSYYAQFQFAEIINKDKSAKILNYGFLDGGFYLTTDEIPSIKYFIKQNVKHEQFPEIMDNQRKYLREKKVDYVITRNRLEEKEQAILDNYTLIKTWKQRYEEKTRTYNLYKKKD